MEYANRNLGDLRQRKEHPCRGQIKEDWRTREGRIFMSTAISNTLTNDKEVGASWKTL